MTKFTQTNEYAQRRAMRECIRKASGLTKSERDILCHVTNLWYHHRNGAGVIYPGRKAVAKKCRCSVATVKRALTKFRKMGFVHPVKYAKGGSKATRYTVDIVAILMTLDGYLLSMKGGIPTLIGEQTRTTVEPIDLAVFSGKNDPLWPNSEPGQNDPRIINMCRVEKNLNQEEVCVVIPFPKAGVRNV